MIPCFRLVSQTDNKFAIDMDEDKCHISQNLKKPSEHFFFGSNNNFIITFLLNFIITQTRFPTFVVNFLCRSEHFFLISLFKY